MLYIKVVFFAYLVNSFLNIVIVYYFKGRTEQDRKDMELRSESLAVSIRRYQDANTMTMYGLSKSFWTFTIKFSFSFQYFKIFCNVNSVLLL